MEQKRIIKQEEQLNINISVTVLSILNIISDQGNAN